MNRYLPLNRAAIGLLLCLGIPMVATAMTPEEKGYEIAAASDRSDQGFADSEVNITMVLRSESGQETTRELSQRILEVDADDLGDRTLIIFKKPADIKGTALLSHAKILQADDQWLYLPAFKRVKRIASVNKDGAFVGSEFSYEDFAALELGKFSYKHVGESACGEALCDIIERVPLYEHSGYTRQIAWIDRDIFQVHKVDFYDRGNELIKSLELKQYKLYQNKYWRAQKLEMINHKTGKSTDLIFSDYVFNNGFSDNDFVKSVLDRLN